MLMMLDQKQMTEFEKGWAETFHKSKIKNNVFNLETPHKLVNVMFLVEKLVLPY